MTSDRDEVAALMGKVVVLDTPTPYVYIGILKEWQQNFVILADADVHDTSEGRSGKDLYLLEVRRNGVQMNRREVYVSKATVVSLSLIEDVVCY